MEKLAYARYRMGLAMDRIVKASTEEEKRRATKWALAWCLSTDADTPSFIKLRTCRFAKSKLGLRKAFADSEQGSLPGIKHPELI